MEFDTNFKEKPPFHQSLFLGKPSKPQMENGVLIESSSLHQNFPNFDKLPNEGYPTNSYFGILNPFYDPFDPFQASLASHECANHIHLSESNPFVSNGENRFVHSYPPGTFLAALNQNQDSQEFGSMKPNFSHEVSCLSMGDKCETKGDSKKKKRVQPKEIKKGHQNPSLVKSQWTHEEDRLLVQLVKHYGEKRWSHIAQMLNGRVGKQCRERWHNHLRPDIKKDIWTQEEEIMLIEAHKQIGNKWASIAKKMPGRTENTIKNHWNATKRRRIPKHKGKYSSILQEYINSLTLDSAQNKSPLSDMSHKDQNGPAHDSDRAVDFGFGPCGSVIDESDVELDKEMEFDVKKEMDLLEMLYKGML